jgi:hypothetical protein
MKTQCERILAHIRKHGSITQLGGYIHYSFTCTSQRITDLRKRGYNIKTRYEKSPNGARYAIWSLGRKK